MHARRHQILAAELRRCTRQTISIAGTVDPGKRTQCIRIIRIAVGQTVIRDVKPTELVGITRETLVRADGVALGIARTSARLRGIPQFGHRILLHGQSRGLNAELAIHTGRSIARRGRISFRRSTRREGKCREATEKQCEMTHGELLNRNLLEAVQRSGVK